jgi:hypothetical protein
MLARGSTGCSIVPERSCCCELLDRFELERSRVVAVPVVSTLWREPGKREEILPRWRTEPCNS